LKRRKQPQPRIASPTKNLNVRAPAKGEGRSYSSVPVRQGAMSPIRYRL
jgi:hypothetical protein